MTPDQRAAAIEYLLRRKPYSFLAGTGVDPLGEAEFAARSFREALATQDGESLHCALSLAFRCDLLRAEHAPLLALLLVEPWHNAHEDVASALQRLRDPGTTDALARAALMKHSYLAYNDSHAFARKCTWALADIGTPEARAHLERLAQEQDAEIASYAQRRLDEWDEEIDRKRKPG